MTYTVRRMTPNSWLVATSPGRVNKIAGVTLHSTRSTISIGDDGPRTEAWFKNPNNNQGGWGGSADEIIFETGERVLVTHYEIEEPTYCAGYGDDGSWSMGEFYYQIEIAQGNLNDPFTPQSIDSLAYRVAELSIKHSFPLIRTAYVKQTESLPPLGINTHDTCRNGTKYGKTDTGLMFPWADFLAKANTYRSQMIGDAPMTPAEKAAFDALVKRVAELENDKKEKVDYVQFVGKPSVYRVEGNTLVHVVNWETFKAQADETDPMTVRELVKGTPEFEVFKGYGGQFKTMPVEMTG